MNESIGTRIRMSDNKKLMIGNILPGDYEDNQFALKLIAKLAMIDEESINQQSRMAFLVNFIFGKKAYELFMETVQDPTVPVHIKKDKPIALGALGDFINDEQFQILRDRLAQLTVSERSTYLLEMALNPSSHDGDETVNLMSDDAKKLGAMLTKTPYKKRVGQLFEGAIFDAIKKSSKHSAVNVGKVTLSQSIVNLTDSKGRPLDTEVPAEEINNALEYVQGLDRKKLNLFMAKAILNYVEPSKGLFFRLDRDLPNVLSEFSPGALDVDIDAPILNSFVEKLRFAFDLKNNRLKDRLGASDASMLKFKKDANKPIKDPVIGMLARAYYHFPELIIKTLPKQVDIEGVIEYLGGTDRSLGVYIGRNPFTAHRYLHKGQKRPQHVEILLDIFATFVQEGRINEYIEKLVIPEAKARGVDDIFGHEGWPRDIEDDDD
jgi:hypothetical protein